MKAAKGSWAKARVLFSSALLPLAYLVPGHLTRESAPGVCAIREVFSIFLLSRGVQAVDRQ